jgi:hypothetical protein
LLPKVFEWARSVHPSQPLTSGLWNGNDWSSTDKLDAISGYNSSNQTCSRSTTWLAGRFEQHVKSLQNYHRPILCTEYMARSVGSTFDTILPIAKRYHVAANWGLVGAKTQTCLPWESWEHPYVLRPPSN